MRSITNLLLLSSLSLALPIHESSLVKGSDILEIQGQFQNSIIENGREYLIQNQGRVFWQDKETGPASGFENSKPSSTEYDQNRHELEPLFIESNGKECVLRKGVSKFPSLAIQAGRGLSDPSMHPHVKFSSYGVFLGKRLPRKKPYLACYHHFAHDPKSGLNSSPIQLPYGNIEYPDLFDILDVIASDGPRCAGLAIFILVPIAYFVLELTELLAKHCVREKSPERE
ncbi:hypothetical protein N7540_013152 [Penicillium herquei]|nr:hypothetical protein N7540_013152 [Penicillium herquei]